MSNHKYLGETIVDIKDSPFKDYTKEDWALYFIEYYGQFDGGHHKQWVMDQVVRILKGTPVIIKLAKWDDGEENWRVSTGDPSQEYSNWVLEMKGDYDEECDEYEYDYDEGIAP